MSAFSSPNTTPEAAGLALAELALADLRGPEARIKTLAGAAGRRVLSIRCHRDTVTMFTRLSAFCFDLFDVVAAVRDLDSEGAAVLLTESEPCDRMLLLSQLDGIVVVRTPTQVLTFDADDFFRGMDRALGAVLA